MLKFQDFKTELSGALMENIRRYELVNPLEVMVFDAISELEHHFDNGDFYQEKFINDFNERFYFELGSMKREQEKSIREFCD